MIQEFVLFCGMYLYIYKPSMCQLFHTWSLIMGSSMYSLSFSSSEFTVPSHSTSCQLKSESHTSWHQSTPVYEMSIPSHLFRRGVCRKINFLWRTGLAHNVPDCMIHPLAPKHGLHSDCSYLLPWYQYTLCFVSIYYIWYKLCSIWNMCHPFSPVWIQEFAPDC